MSGPGVSVPRQGATGPRRSRVAVLVALAIVFSTLAAPAAADVAESDIRAAEVLVGEAAARLRDAEADLAAGHRRLERLEDSLSSVAESLERQGDEIVAERAETRDRIARMYMTAGGGDSSALLGLGRITDLPAHLAYLGALADQDREFVNSLAVTRSDLERLQGTIEGSITEQAEVNAGLAEVVAQRHRELESAQAEVATVAAQWQRQEDERRAREQAELRRQEEEARRQLEAEEQARREEEARQQAALAAMQAAAAAAAAAGWTPGAGVEPWRPLVQKHFPAGMVDDALAVMYCESKGDPLALNRYSAASGLFQHLPYYWPSRAKAAGWDGADIFDPEANIAVSAWLVRQSGGTWSHWSCKP